ncbi:hypothetical protein NSQ91_08950 [Paenibacillus sp. FSL R7-0048]|uniref:hypothetical protein n=1 Tax=Paenibacillus TaxID=44249 RepID=UPI00096C187E|nr:hypothetical protein [Paenibacillus odorifer]OMD73345.1 hypothetical protein BSK48_05640 [Paenibacillus odorifer]
MRKPFNYAVRKTSKEIANAYVKSRQNNGLNKISVDEDKKYDFSEVGEGEWLILGSAIALLIVILAELLF